MKLYCIPDADELYASIVDELPTERGEAYYALSMVLEMIESRRTELVAEDAEMSCEKKTDGSCKRHGHHYELTIDAKDLDDLRAQMMDAYESTFSELFEDEAG